MRSRISIPWVMMLAALLLSLVPAAAITAPPAEALTSCNWAQFIADVTVPDGTNVALGLTFTKTWRLKNIGTCTWTTSYSLVFSSGDQLGGPSSVPLPNSVAPGNTVDLSVNLTAPGSAGHYIGFWQLKSASGALFGIGSNANKTWWVDINVLPPSNIGVAYDFAANYCSATWSSTQGNLPCPGADGDSRGFVLKVDNPQLENGSTETGSGLILMPQNAFNGDIHGTFPAFHVQSGDRFRSIVNCASGAASCFVTFRLDYQIGDGPLNMFWSLREKSDGQFFRTDLDLSRLAGQDVKFILTVLATGSADGDRALWVNPVIARPGPVPPASYARNFDFGTSTSPLATGYTRVTATTIYTTGLFGWASSSGLESRDRGSPSDALKRDFVTGSSSAGTFKVDLPNGTYAVTVTMGDSSAAHDNMVVKANGATVLPDVDTAAGAFSVNTFNATVSSDTLSLEFSDVGGSSPSWVVNGIAISSGSTPPAGCDRAQFVTDVTVPDGTTFAPGAAFTKTWRLKNVGTCTWTTSYALVFDSGEKMSGPDSVPMPQSVAPGATVDVPVNLTAPSVAGSYRGFWKFQNASGVRFGVGAAGTGSWFVDIRVAGVALGRNYDFGTASSPVASGYNRVTESTAYTSGGFGWTDTSTLESRDRSGVSDPLKRDFVMDSSAARTFQVDLPNGSYAVNVIMGDRDHAHDNMVVKVNGTTALGDVDTSLGSYASNTFNATTTTGSLAFEFSDSGGTDPTWVVNALTIASGSSLPAACDRAQFVTDVTVPDGTTFAPGATFTKTWRLKNVGACTWTTSYALVFDTGDKMGGPDSVNLPKAVAPGQTVDVSVDLTAPATTGSVRGYWRFQNPSGARFGLGSAGTKSWWVAIKVSGTPATSTPTPTPTATTTPSTVTPVPGLIVHGYVRLQDGSGVPGVTICRSFASYNGVVVATTDATGYFQSDFTFIPGDEMVTVWPVASGYTFQPGSVYWRHYYGPEDHTADFVASSASAAQSATAATPPCPIGTPPPSTATPTPTQTPPPTSTPTPTPTTAGTDTTGWNTYLNSKYLFSFKFPPGSSIMSQSDNAGRVYLPVTPGTNLSQKWVSVDVVEGADPCKSPTTGIVTSTGNVTINGIQFFKEISMDGAAGSTFDATAYSTLKGNACISLTFVLRSANLGNFETPPPAFDKAAESAVFDTIMSTYANQ